MKSAVSSRMKPARQTRSTRRFRSSADYQAVVRLASHALRRQHHGRQAAFPGRLDSAQLPHGSKSPRRSPRSVVRAATLSAIASKLDPRPESRIPSRFTLHRPQRRHLHTRPSAAHSTTSPIWKHVSPRLLNSARAFPRFALRDHQDHADSQVERPPLVALRDIADLAQQLEDRRHGPRTNVDARTPGPWAECAACCP